jgi:hypothetical protein
MQESMENENRGSQPPKQPLPIPHTPYWEQQGRFSGHFWVASQDGVLSAETNAVNVDTASAAEKIHRVILPRSKKAILKEGRKKGVGLF